MIQREKAAKPAGLLELEQHTAEIIDPGGGAERRAISEQLALEHAAAGGEAAHDGPPEKARLPDCS